MTATHSEEEDAIIYPIAFNIEEANREIDVAEQELNEGNTSPTKRWIKKSSHG